MYGWRGRIGLILPSPNVVMEPELYRVIPEGISVFTTRVLHTTSNFEGLASLSDNVERAAGELATAKVDIIAFACTSGSIIKGESYEKELRKRIERASGGIPAVTVISSVIDALKVLKIKKLIVSSPYTKDVNDMEKDYLEKAGFNILDIRGLSIEESLYEGYEPPYRSYRMSREMYEDNPQAEGIFISCTNFRTIEIINKLETDTGLPVVSSNQATLWNCLGRVNCQEPVKGYGRLLERCY